MQKRYGLMSDTHGFVHPDFFEIFQGVEAILHAGDVGDETVIAELTAIAPVYAVRGNVDLGSALLPAMRIETFDFGVAVITHSHLLDDKIRNPQGMAKHFKQHEPRLILYGHSHLQYCARHQGIWVVNPGPACKPRFNERQSVAIMTWDSETDEFDFELKGLKRV